MTDETSSPPDSNTGGTADGSRSETTQQLHHHLAATAELPIDRGANRWLGEAEAIARDVAMSDLDSGTILERVEKTQRLLSEVDQTGHEGADDHLETARRLCAEILDD